MGLHLFDTQLVSYAVKETRVLPSVDLAISSTTAQELLLLQGCKLTSNNYYVPRIMRPHMIGNSFRSVARSIPGKYRGLAGKRSTDRLIFDFGSDYPRVIEYSHQAIATALNCRNFSLLEDMARALGPEDHQVVVRRLRFLGAQNFYCLALNPTVAEAALSLFYTFAGNYVLKKKFRNSLNDILTLAVAETYGAILHTDDQLLARFAERYSNVPVNLEGDFITIDFESTAATKPVSRETKGYINRGWRVHGLGGLVPAYDEPPHRHMDPVTS